MPNNGTNPVDVYLTDPEEINHHWLFWRADTRRNFKIGNYAICFIRLSYDSWLLTTIKLVTEELHITNGPNYKGEEVERFKPFFGRVIVKFHKNFKGTILTDPKKGIDKIEVLNILSHIYDREDFPGYDNVTLTWDQLKIIIDRRKKDWIHALENQKGVSLITDTHAGKHYIGSAYGENGMLLGRWSNYISNGHGGNKELKEIVELQGKEYIEKNFQYTYFRKL